MTSFNEFVSYPNIAEPLPFTPSAIFVGGAGTLVIQDSFGNLATFNVPSGSTVLVEATLIASMSTATDLVLMRRRAPF